MRHELAKLSNGTRVVLVPHQEAASVTLLALFEVGSRYETEALSGASHFIEHLMFKGTARRKNTMAISRDLDAVGADYNAFTGKDYTGYYIKLQAGKLSLATDMLSDMLYHSRFAEKDIESERKVIFEEIRMYDDSPSSVAEEAGEESLFDGSPLARRISGTVGTVSGLSRDALAGFRDQYYVPERTVLSLAGKFDRDAALALLEKTFGQRPRSANPAQPFVPFANHDGFTAPRVRLVKKATEQAQLLLLFPSYGYGDERRHSLNLLSTILGGTMSSRLFMSVREKRGLAYMVRSGSDYYQDIGVFSVHAGVDKERALPALKVIVQELKRICEKEVTAEELRRAKEYLRGKTSLALEDSSRLADWFARQELLQKRIETPEDRLAKVFAVTKEQIRRVAADIIRGDSATLSMVGPFDDQKPFAKAISSL